MLFSKNQIEQIRKRDGRIVNFDQSKIAKAIAQALEAVGEKREDKSKKLSNDVINELNKKFHPRSIPAVEEIQDIVEEVLVKNKEFKTAKAYIIYREQHSQIREMKKLMNIEELVEGYLDQSDWRVKENSNMSYSLQGLNNHVASSITAKYWLNKIYPVEIRDAHTNGDIHIHDLGYLCAYCVGWDLRDLLISGFQGVSGKIQSKPPKHLRTAMGQVVNFFYTLQGEAAGAQAFSNFDTLLAPFIRYDKLKYKDVKQIMQEYLFGMNIPTRVGFQTPFTNITMDLKPSEAYANESVVIGGKLKKEKYKDFQEEMTMFNKAFIEVMLEGDAKGRVFTFPIPTYNITKDFDWENPELEGLWEMASKYGIPYFSNFVNSDMKPEDARSMCCRLRLDNRELRKRGGGLFGANPLTGSIGVVTINMPRIGYLSKTKEEFFQRLGRIMDLAKASLEIKRKILEQFTDEGLYPYSRFYLRSVRERFGEFWKNHFNTVGFIGLNEAMMNFFGKDIGSKEGKEFATEIMDFMREKLMDYQNETNNLFNLEATPGEGTSFRLAKADKKVFADIITANETQVKNGAAPYYTNSSHLPVNYTDDLFEVLDHQDNLQTRYTGGTVVHLFLGESLPTTNATKQLIKKIANNYHLPYYTITPTFSVCPKHGYIAGEHFYCPYCDEEIGFQTESVKTSSHKTI